MMRRVLPYVLLGVGTLVVTFPFVWMITTAFKTQTEATMSTLNLWPSVWQWRNFAETFRAAPFARYFFNSFLVAFTVTAAVIVTSLMAGYAFARLEFPGSRILFGLVLATMMIPFEVTLIPNFVLIRRLDWYNAYPALIVPWCANAFSIFLMRQAFLSLPSDYFDAAKVDGCGHLRFLARIAAPLVKPMVVTVGLFAFLGSYNSLLWPLVVTSEEAMRVVQVGLTVFSGAEGVRLHLLMCASAIVILPTVALYFAAQRYFLEGSIGAGIKG
ncbi:MAG TPA: carbohydrate ABC transporter permease [Candidatus Hydrogenedentes bacterium]|nr:carbohydrate ABC transporter permease [Candidatus Hydrogenedentota bacterium]HPG69976.1 carbohydrate ABC transporter permease [Candidatus Hydrogenedentota bacterium]